MFTSEVLQVQNDLISWRRTLHRKAELSFEEYETTAFIAKTLQSFGVTEISYPCKTGLVATIRGEKAGTPIRLGIRADIDALPIAENTNLAFASEHHGVMHACGHDGHAAMALALAKLLFAHREAFCGDVCFLFQHAEELPPGGAIEMVRAGAADGLDCVLGMHLSSAFELGSFGLRAGALTANTDRFDITVLGKGGHCAYPEQCTDPIVIGAQIITALQTLVSRRSAACEPVVISVCHVTAGNAYNIIPNEMTITGTTRCFGAAARDRLKQQMHTLVTGICEASGAACDFSWQEGYPSVMNDETLTALAEAVVSARFGKAAVLRIDPLMPGEDYPYFLENGKRVGFFAEIGTRSDKPNCDMPHHNPLYCMDEDALAYGLQYLYDMTLAIADGERRYV